MLRNIFRRIKPKVKSPQIECEPRTAHYLYNKYIEILDKTISLGQGGAFVLTPQSLLPFLIQNCNLDCIMCYLPKSANYFPLDEIKRMVQFTTQKPTFGKVSAIELTSAESLLHPAINQITKYFKGRFPDADISLITNGTLKVQEKIEEAVRDIDRISISMDGAKKETFEHIRRNANFEHVLRNIRDIVAIKQPMGQHVGLVFVAMANNMHELPALVNLASDLGIASIFVQKLELRLGVQYDSMKPYDLDNLSREAVQSILDKTMEESKKTGVFVQIANILPPTSPSVSLEEFYKKRMCSYLWKNTPMFNEKVVLYPCCHMQSAEYRNHYDQYALRTMNLIDFYNNHDYWSMRSKILAGEFANTVCKDCQYYKFAVWTNKDLEDIQNFVGNIAAISGTKKKL